MHLPMIMSGYKRTFTIMEMPLQSLYHNTFAKDALSSTIMGSAASQGPSLPFPRHVTLGELLTSRSICSSVKSGDSNYFELVK